MTETSPSSPLRPGSIVVGVDGSEDSARAVAWGARQAALEHRPLVLLHSADQPILHDSAWLNAPPGIDHVQLAEQLDRAAHAVLAEAARVAAEAAPTVETTTRQASQDARAALIDASRTAHLLVLGSRGRGPLRTALLGSVSARVSRHAHCPVVVCRPRRQEAGAEGRIVVGADGTPASLPVLDYAFAQASFRGAPLTVMHCFFGVDIDAGSTDLDDLRVLLSQSVAGLREKYPDVTVRTELAVGLVDQCLTDRTPDADLIVVGRVLPSGWSRFVHFSCALAVLERAHTTVAVVPELPSEKEQ